jgi:hypothetical protein
MKTMVWLGAFGVALAVLGAGCGGTYYSGLASHTIATGPDTSADVVWIESTRGEVFRCDAASGQPVCREATPN